MFRNQVPVFRHKRLAILSAYDSALELLTRSGRYWFYCTVASRDRCGRHDVNPLDQPVTQHFYHSRRCAQPYVTDFERVDARTSVLSPLLSHSYSDRAGRHRRSIGQFERNSSVPRAGKEETRGRDATVIKSNHSHNRACLGRRGG